MVLGAGGNPGGGTGLRWGRTVHDECEVPVGWAPGDTSRRQTPLQSGAEGTAPLEVQIWESAYRKVRKE